MINSVALMGRLTYEPEIKRTPSGVAVIRFQIAVDRNYVASGQERQADFIDCIAWRKTAEFVNQYFNKGSLIGIEGSIETENYEKDGQKRKSTVVNVRQASFCGAKENGSQSFTQPEESKADVDFEEIEDADDLPF
jgi:single-strand DNA-binding protein